MQPVTSFNPSSHFPWNSAIADFLPQSRMASRGLGEAMAANAAFMRLARRANVPPPALHFSGHDYELGRILPRLRDDEGYVQDTIGWMMDQVDETAELWKEQQKELQSGYFAEEEAEQQKELQSLDQGRLKCTAKEPFPGLLAPLQTAVADFLATYVPPKADDDWACKFCNGELKERCDWCKQAKACCEVCDVHLRSTYLLPGVDAAYSFCVPCLQDREVDVDYFSTFY